MRAIIALAPVGLFLIALVHGDSYKLLRFRTVLTMTAVGALAAGASYLINSVAYGRFAGDFSAYSRDISPWIEEALKAAVLVVLIRTRRVGLPVDAGILGFAVGAGFAFVENFYYLVSRPDLSLPVQIIRGFGTAIMHGGTAAAMAIISVMVYDRRPHGGLQLLLPGYLAAVAMHSAFNYLLVWPRVATLAMALLVPLMLYAVFLLAERMLQKWLSDDLDSKVQLLAAINGGGFLDSHSGRYLQSLRERFRGEDLVNMLCVLRLHGELALRAKGILMLRECGMEEPPVDAEDLEKLSELAQLERELGKTGMLALRPLMMTTGKDIWQLRLLKQ